MKTLPTVDLEYTTKEFATYTKVKPSRIRQLLAAGVIKGTKPNGSRDWWIPASQIEIVNNRQENRGKQKKVSIT